MKPPLLITSSQNERIKELVRLKNRSERDKTDLFLIEGYRELLRAVDAETKIFALFFCPDFFLGSNENQLIERVQQQGAHLFQCSKQVFEKISYRDRPDGLVATAPQRHLKVEDLVLSKNPFLVVAEAIEKPGNLGTILRSCDAVGVDGLIVCDRCTDIHNPNVVRASVGTLFTVDAAEDGSLKTIAWLKSKGIAIAAATPSAEIQYTDADFTKPVAIVVGTEQLGLSKIWMEAAEIKVAIPMLGVADSLNVATATTVILYEVLRQRSRADER